MCISKELSPQGAAGDFFFLCLGGGPTIVHYLRSSSHKAPQANIFFGFRMRVLPLCIISGAQLIRHRRRDHFLRFSTAGPIIVRITSSPAYKAPPAFFFFRFLKAGHIIGRILISPAKKAPQANFFFSVFERKSDHCAYYRQPG